MKIIHKSVTAKKVRAKGEDTRPRAFSYLRMSTDLQLKGDSRRRQIEKSKKYAAEHGLRLLEGDQLEDIGISAYRGANVREGALGKFIQAVRDNAIERGSFLLVESFDRLFRQHPTKALRHFLEIINAGITVVTLEDEHVWSEGKTNDWDLFQSLVIMSRAHDESLKKSKRLSEVWANKRTVVDRSKLTRICPAWMKASTGRINHGYSGASGNSKENFSGQRCWTWQLCDYEAFE
jgi:DNA invertase Pin-like site-specific DNA recombinase